ncbi:MAG: MotA/TolQ/ExbB proton channel family protein [Lentisphaerae bacterium]|nr:MotA/TolQ/ExbB proton channel family protein [Lentisphaerota bacterium]
MMRKTLLVACVALACAAARPPAATAQEEAAPAAASATAPAATAGGARAEEATAPAGASGRTTMNLREIVASGGSLMYVLAGMSVLAVAMIVYFFIVLRAGQVVPRALRRELMDKLRTGNVDDARRACEYRPSPLAAVCLAAIDHVRDIPQTDPMLLKDVVEGEGQRQSETMQGQAQYLLDIAVVAPMVGLLGTVLGMLRAFNGIALEIDRAKPVVLAAGVSQALVTTVFGLIVGIPAMAFYAYFRRRASKLVSQLEVASTEVLTALLRKKSE